MSFVRRLMHSLRALWARLFGPAPARAALPEPAPAARAAESPGGGPTSVAPTSIAPLRVAEAPVAAASAVAPIVVTPPPEDSLVAAAMAAAGVPGAAGESAAGLSGVIRRAAVEATPESPAPRGEAQAFVADARPALSVRQFFARVAAAAPGGLSVDFSAWQSASVERFFMAMAAPERAERRGPALAEAVSLDGAFAGFEWD